MPSSTRRWHAAASPRRSPDRVSQPYFHAGQLGPSLGTRGQRGRRSRSTADAPKAIPTAAAAVKSTELEVDDINEDTLEDDESLPEDTSDLVGGDDDDVSDVIENVGTDHVES